MEVCLQASSEARTHVKNKSCTKIMMKTVDTPEGSPSTVTTITALDITALDVDEMGDPAAIFAAMAADANAPSPALAVGNVESDK